MRDALRDAARDDFYPRPPRGGRQLHITQRTKPNDNFYPRPPRGGRPSNGGDVRRNGKISIHALREEGDDGVCIRGLAGDISIHALREEGDRDMLCDLDHSVISIHALREEGDLCEPCCSDIQKLISIHALREEGDNDPNVTAYWME